MSNLTTSDWNLLSNGPHWVKAAIIAVDGKGALLTQRKESKALEDAVGSFRGRNSLISRVRAYKGDADKATKGADIKAAKSALARISALLDAKADLKEAEEYREFLVHVGEAVTEAAGEGFLGAGDNVSKKETKAMKEVVDALNASTTDRLNREVAAKKSSRATAAKTTSRSRAAAKSKTDDAAAAAERKAAVAARAAERKAAKRREAASERMDAAAADKRKKEVEARAAARRAAKAKDAKADAAVSAKAASAAASAKAAKSAAAANKRAARAKGIAEARAKAAANRGPKYIAEHTVGGGDTLSHIALKYYGSAARDKWMAIFEANRDVIGDNPNVIIAGQKLNIPQLD